VSVTSSCPDDTASRKPNPRRARNNVENAEPEWVTRLTPPSGNGSGSRYPIARTPSALFTKPMQPAPHNAIPASVAIAVSVSRRPCADEQHRRPCTRGGRGGQLVGQHGVRNAEQYHVDGLVEVGQ
jgi:hypothetical protein